MKKTFQNFFDRNFTLLLSLMIIFRQSVGVFNEKLKYFFAGNLNILYLYGVLEIFKSSKDKQEIKKFLLIFLCLLFILLMQCLFVSHVSLFNGIINILKITLCFSVMVYFFKNSSKISLEDFLKYSTIIYLLIFILSLIFRNDIFWRFNDNVNRLATTRLQLLFTEPSEIGLNCSPLIIISVGLFFQTKNLKLLYPIPIVLILLYFAKPMAGIMILAISLSIMFIFFLYKNLKNKKLLILILFITFLVTISLLFNQDFYIGQRILRIISGQDSSTNYRILVSSKVAIQALIDTFGLGVGFSSVDNAFNVLKYSDLGLVDVGITASYFNAIAEFGIFAIMMIVILNILMVKSLIKDFSYVKLGLYIFIILYQFMGTFFTNPLCWIIYGFILSQKDNIKLIKENGNV